MSTPCRLISRLMKLTHHSSISPKTLFEHLNLKQLNFRQTDLFRAIHLTRYSLSGHSHWENIRHIKSAKDNERSNIFRQLSHQMEVAIRHGGSNDPAKNPKLSALVQQCKRQNMPKATLQKILNQATDCEDFLLSFSGPGGSAILVACEATSLKDAKSHLSHSVKKSKLLAGKLDFSLQSEFEKKRFIMTDLGSLDAETVTEETATDIAIDVGAEDVDIKMDENGTSLEFTCDDSNYTSVEKAIGSEEHGLTILASEFEYVPKTEVDLNESDKTSVKIFLKALMMEPDIRVAKMFRLINVFHNINDFTTISHT